MTTRWFRDIYRDAVWESEDLTAVEKAVAETYARHARDANDAKTPNADLAWLTYPRLMAKAGIGRRANVSAAVASLARNEGRSLDLIEKVFPIVAADPNTRFPGRLPNDGDWWNINQQGCVGVRENANARAAAGWLTIPVDDRPIMHPLTHTPPTP